MSEKTEQVEIDGEVVTVVYGNGEIERLTADDGVYEGEVVAIMENGVKTRMIPHGRGTFKWTNEDMYEGEWEFNTQHGKGRFTFADGGYFQGDWVHNQQHGYGFLKDCNGAFEGEFLHDERKGSGKQVYKNNDVYTGSWLHDMRHGGGLQKWADGAHYEGEWAKDTMNGRGLYTFQNGDQYEGDFESDQKTGIGQYIWADPMDQLIKYVGGFQNGKRHGEGIERYRNGDWQIGTWHEGEHCGDGVLHTREPEGPIGDKQEFQFDAVSKIADELKPEVPDRIWELLEEANKTGEVLQVGLPKEMEEELLKAQREIQKAEEVVRNIPNFETERKKRVEREQQEKLLREKKEREDKERAEKEKEKDPGDVSSQSLKDVAQCMSPGGSFSAQNIDEFLKEHGDEDNEDLHQWRLGNLLGQGSYGAVYAGLKRDGGMMAVKCIELGNIQEDEDVNALVNEIDIMKTLSHTNIVRYLGASKDPTADILYIFLEYVPGGSLAAVIKKFGTLDLETARRYTKQICFAITFLHSKGIIHRDIKGDNILVTSDGIVKLADFGCSKNLLELQAKTHGVAAKSMVGTPYWMAPEVITNQEQGYSFTADIWSIGCTVVEMLTGKPPWPEFSSMWGAVFHIANSTGPPEGIPSDLPAEIKHFLDSCFQRDVSKRYTASQLLGVQWMKS